MKITSIYIKQCEKAKEIQKAWRPELADWFYSKGIDDSVLILGFTKESRKAIKKGIWLPTQEQLQEMVMTRDRIKHCWMLGWLIENIYNFHENKHGYEGLPEHYVFYNFKDMNELWLAFVMYEKYNKIWTGKTWVKANE